MRKLVFPIVLIIFGMEFVNAQSNPNDWTETNGSYPFAEVYVGVGFYYDFDIFLRVGQQIGFNADGLIYTRAEVKYGINGSWKVLVNNQAGTGLIIDDNPWSIPGEYQLEFKIWDEAGNSQNHIHKVYVMPAASRSYIDNSGNRMIVWGDANPIDMPFFVIEGFDPTNKNNANLYYAGALDFFNAARSAGEDIIVIQFKDGGADMVQNALIIEEAIKYINTIKNSTNQMKVIGVSMGGVIGRYVLTKAEVEIIDLEVSHFVSLDSPQQGAILDKEFVDFIYDKQPWNPGLNSMAARQLLIYNPFSSNSEHDSFYNLLNSLNSTGYPTIPKNIGVSFSPSELNPRTGKWLDLEVELVNIDNIWTATITKESFYIDSGEEIQAGGSYLPIESTMIWGAPMLSLKFWEKFTRFEFERTNIHPTFIPHKSALDLDPIGNSKFDVTISSSAPSFHDSVPTDIVGPLLYELGIENPNYFFYNTTISNNRSYLNEIIEIGDNVTVIIEGEVSFTDTEVFLGKDAKIEVRNGGKLITDGATFTRLNPADQYGGIKLYTSNNVIENTTIEGGYYGLYMGSNSDNNTIENSVFDGNRYGIYAYNSDGSIIKGLTIENSSGAGIWAYYSSLDVDPAVTSGIQTRTTIKNGSGHGITASLGSTVSVRNTTLTNITKNEFMVYSSGRMDLGYHSSGNTDHGNNLLSDAPNSTSDPVFYRYVYSMALTGSGETATQWEVPARKNYWHDGNAPNWIDFLGSVDYSNHLTSNPTVSAKVIAFNNVESAETGRNKLKDGFSNSQIDNSIRFKDSIQKLKEEIENLDYSPQIAKLIRTYSGMIDASDKELMKEEIKELRQVKRKWLSRFQFVNDIAITDTLKSDLSEVDMRELNTSVSDSGLVHRVSSVQTIGEVILALEMRSAIEEEKFGRVFKLVKEYDGRIRGRDLKFELISYLIKASIETQRNSLALRLIDRLEAMEPEDALVDDWIPLDFTSLRLDITDQGKFKGITYGDDDQLAQAFESDIDLGLDELINEMVTDYKLYSAYPNPFNPSTTITFDLPEQGRVRVDVFDISGRLVSMLANQEYQQGNHRLTFDASGLASGVYFVRANIAGNIQTQRITLIK